MKRGISLKTIILILLIISSLFAIMFVVRLRQVQLISQRVNITTNHDPAKGSVFAPITIIIFGDFQCPYSAKLNGWVRTDKGFGYDETQDIIKRLSKKYGNRIRFVYRDFPLRKIHPYALEAAEAAECAHAQGSFWEYHDKLYQNIYRINNNTLNEFAAEIGLDMTTFDECLDSGRMEEEILSDIEDGLSAGVRGTPTTFINGVKIVGAKRIELFEEVIDKERLRLRKYFFF